MNRKEWYREFRMRFNPEKAPPIKSMYKSYDKLKDPDWTRLTAEFLRRMAKDSGFTVTPEHPAFGGGRFDMKWKKGREEIFIEYENDNSGVKGSEIPKLMSAGGNLRVLITYIPANFPGEDLLVQS